MPFSHIPIQESGENQILIKSHHPTQHPSSHKFLIQQFFRTSKLMESDHKKPRIVCCIGDIHGHIDKLQNLWRNLETQIGQAHFQTASIIFLGDYCDRGPNTKEVIDFLVSLPQKYPNQSHVFLSGNHDLAFGAFLGLLPNPPDGSPFSDTWSEFELSETREGWYKGEGYENMHLQGRRWAGKITVKENTIKGTEYLGSIYDAGPTFESYGVEHGSSDLMRAVPDEHKKFLADMVWIHEEDNVSIETEGGMKNCKLIAVHGGLEKRKSVQEQLHTLKTKDTRIPKVEALSGRKSVWDIPEELSDTSTIVVSGHHGKLHMDGLRLVIDEGGGLKSNPIAAVVLPSQKIVRDTDNLTI